MTQATQPTSPLRQRMIEDMTMRKLSPKTQTGYVRAVRKLTRFLGHPPDTATAEELRKFQLYMVDHGTSAITLNSTITALRFFFDVTVGRADVVMKMSTVRVPQKLPVVLSPEEVARLIAAAGKPEYRAALSVAYGAGLRASEVVGLKTTDIDSRRMTLRVEQGKGHKDRYAMLSPVLLDTLRTWWRVGHAKGKLHVGGWLFPGRNPVNPMTTRQLNRVCHAAVAAAQIDKRVSLHTLRHYLPYRIMSSNKMATAHTYG